MLWSDVRQAWQHERQHQAPIPALQSAIDQVFDARIGDVSGRGKLAADMREIWMMQPRFDKRAGHGPMTLVTMARFRAGFDFMRLRADVGEVDEALADWWQTFSLADESEREDMLAQVRPSNSPRTRSKSTDMAGPVVTSDEPPKRRRRRRRKPGDSPNDAGASSV